MQQFIVTEICDTRKTGSTVSIGKILKGELDSSGRQIYFDDVNGQQWVFWVGDTCELMPGFIDRFNRYLVKMGYPNAETINVYDTGVEAIIVTVPHTDHFTNWHKLKDGRYYVRLSSGDYFNHALTKGLF